MELSTIIEVIRIKQEVREEMVALEQTVIRSPEDASQIGASFIGDDDREVFLVIMLNTKNRVIGVHRAHVGSINSSVVHPREIFKCAILNNASCIIACHQHPSGTRARAGRTFSSLNGCMKRVTSSASRCSTTSSSERTSHMSA